MNTQQSAAAPTPKRKRKIIKRVLTAVDVIRQQLLLKKWDELKDKGRKLVVADIWKQQKCSASLPYQYLNGEIALTVDWMMIFAQYMELTPQEIWGKHWPYPNLTPIFCPKGFENVVFHFGKVIMVFRRVPPTKLAKATRELINAVKALPRSSMQLQGVSP